MTSLLRRLARALEAPPAAEHGGLPWSAFYPDKPPPALPPPAAGVRPIRAVVAATSPVTLAVANPDRGALTLVNDSTATLYVKHGPGASSAAGGYTAIVGPGATYILEPPDPWQGELSGVWTAANGAASITETR